MTTNSQVTLKRSVTLPLLTLYGLGTIIGAGIYVLIGEIAQLSGLYSPVAFFIAAVIAGFTALTYAELSSRFPKSAGVAYYSQQAFQLPWLAAVLGWSIVIVGVVSAATMANGFVGYFQHYVELPAWLIIFLLVLTMAAIAAWGISESVWVATVVTILEVGGLIFVLVISGDSVVNSEVTIADMVPPLEGVAWSGVFLGAFLAFYAFIGFEDMVNIAEEVKNPQRTLPIAIVLAIGISTLLYVAVAIVAVYVLPPDVLGASDAPLKDIVKENSEMGVPIISGISLIAVINGALIQLIMAARVLYGMAHQNIAPRIFGNVNSRTRTPLIATFVAALFILILALGFSLVFLAKATSLITLLVFAMMHLVLIKIKSSQPQPENAMVYPAWIPVVGLILAVALIILQFPVIFDS